MNEAQTPSVPNPTSILQFAFAFFGSKVLLSAVRMGLFTTLADKSLSAALIQEKLGLHPRATYDFLDTLVALKFLEREGSSNRGLYKNSLETNIFLDKNKETYIGGVLEMANDRLFKFWGDLDIALKTGLPQNEVKHGKSMFADLYNDPERLEQFISAMSGISIGNFVALAEKFDFSKYKTLCDVGGAAGVLSASVARKHPNISCTTFDLPVVEPIAKRALEKAGLSNRVKTAAGDFFQDKLPKADVITMGLVLHDWNLENKMKLIRAAYEALPENGAFIVVENLIDDDRRENAFGLMMSLNMLIEFGDAFDYSFADFKRWCLEVGFKRFECIHLEGPASAGIAYK
jgi:2-polyprenyl-3-methyl-5-hydroxy-6-metoxy-1,4-benzoquinol methylase